MNLRAFALAETLGGLVDFCLNVTQYQFSFLKRAFGTRACTLIRIGLWVCVYCSNCLKSSRLLKKRCLIFVCIFTLPLDVTCSVCVFLLALYIDTLVYKTNRLIKTGRREGEIKD